MKVKVHYQSNALFARLPLALVKKLHQEARNGILSLTCNDPVQHGQAINDDNSDFQGSPYWNLLTSSSQDIDFLPLKIVATTPGAEGSSGEDETKVVYASYNGGHSTSGYGENAIELHPSLFHGFNVLPTQCSIFALAWIPNAPRVRVYPCSVEDWELLECHARYLQEGGFLSQISVVYPNQVIPLNCSASSYKTDEKDFKNVAYIRILEDDCFSLPNYENNKCLRLIQETLIEIIPYTRGSCWSQPLPLAPIYSDVSSSTEKIIRCLLKTEEVNPISSSYLHQIQNNWKKQHFQDINQHDKVTVFAHHETIRQYVPRGDTMYPKQFLVGNVSDFHVQLKSNKTMRGNSKDELDQTGAVITVADLVLDESIPVGFVALPTLTRYKLGLSLLFDNIQLQLIQNERKITEHQGISDRTNELKPQSNQILRHLRINTNAKLELPSWRLPTNAVPLFPDWVEEAISKNYENNNIKYENLEVPPADHVFHSMPSTHTSIVGQEQNIMESLSFFIQSKNKNRGLVICGEEGSGKTHISLIVANLLSYTVYFRTIYVDCKKLITSSQGAANLNSILAELTHIFHDAYEQRSSLIILDDVDYLVPNVFARDNAALSLTSLQQQQTYTPLYIHQVKVISDHLLFLLNKYCLADIAEGANGSNLKTVHILCTCKEKQSLHPTLFRFFMMDSYIKLPTRIDGRARYCILHHMVLLQNNYQRSDKVAADAMDSWLLSQRLHIEQDTDGFRPSDLFILACRILQQFFKMSSVGGDDTQLCWRKVVGHYTTLSLRSSSITHSFNIHSNATTNTAWSDVGGLFRAKELLDEAIVSPIKFYKVYSKCVGIKLPRGVLLYGPSGCGKTYIVSALANRCHLKVISVKGPELLDKYIGASEAKVRQVFQNAFAASPCILFFDDFDALAPKRGSDNTGVTDRVVNQLLTLLDGVESFGDDIRVYIIAATSRPDKLDAALLRPGRLERHIYIGLPETEDERRDVASTVARKYPFDAAARKFLEDLLLQPSSMERLNDFSPADFQALFTTAYLQAIDSNVSRSTANKNMIIDLNIQSCHLSFALGQTKPSMSIEDKVLFYNMYRRFRRRDDPISGNFASIGNIWSDEHSDVSGRKLETAMR